MASRKIDELATDIDDAATVAEELQDSPLAEAWEKLDELQETLEHAADTIDELEETDE